MYNKITLVGYLGRKPEMKTPGEGATFSKAIGSIATTETYKDKEGERQTKTYWHNLVFWNKLADTATKYLDKGDLVMIEGKSVTRLYKDMVPDTNTEFTRSITEVVVVNLVMLPKGNRSKDVQPSTEPSLETSTQPSTQPVNENVAKADVSNDELPF